MRVRSERPRTARWARALRGEAGPTVVALALLTLAFVATASFGAITLPATGSQDSYDHLDYVLQVARGGLPEPVGHVFVPAGWDVGVERIVERRQFASAHPPGYYWVSGLLVGGLLEAGDADRASWELAVALLRGLNVALGVGGLLWLAHAGWHLGGRLRAYAAVALPAGGAFSYAYLRFGAEVYGDMLLTLASIGAVVLAATVLVRGLTTGRLVGITVVCVIGMLTKSTFVLPLALACGAVLIAGMARQEGGRLARVLRATALPLLPAIAAIAASGWFYARNVAASGTWYRSTPKEPLDGRPYRTALDVLTDPQFYAIVPSRLVGTWADQALPAGAASAALFAALAVVTARLLATRFPMPGTPSATGWWATAVMLVALLAGGYVMQLSHATGYGAYNARYFLVATPAIAAILVVGLIAVPVLRTAAIPLVAAALIAGSCLSMGVHATSLGGTVGPELLLLVAAGAVAALATALPLAWLEIRRGAVPHSTPAASPGGTGP